MPFVASRTSASTASHVVHGALRASICEKSSVRDADGNGSVDGETPGDGRKRIMPDARRHVPTRVSAAKKNGTTGAPASIAPVKTVRTTPSAETVAFVAKTSAFAAVFVIQRKRADETPKSCGKRAAISNDSPLYASSRAGRTPSTSTSNVTADAAAQSARTARETPLARVIETPFTMSSDMISPSFQFRCGIQP